MSTERLPTERQLKGIKGWLAFLVIVLCLVSPTLTIARQLVEFYAGDGVGAGWESVTLPLWAIAISTSVGTACLGVALIVLRRRSTVFLVIGGLWAIALFDFLSRAATMSAAFEVSYIDMLMGSGFGQLRPFFFCAIWTAYLLRSRRVANTYPSRSGPDELEQVFD